MSDQEIDRLFREKLRDRPFEPSASELAEAQALLDQRAGGRLGRWFKPGAFIAVVLVAGYIASRVLSAGSTDDDQRTERTTPSVDTSGLNGTSTGTSSSAQVDYMPRTSMAAEKNGNPENNSPIATPSAPGSSVTGSTNGDATLTPAAGTDPVTARTAAPKNATAPITASRRSTSEQKKPATSGSMARSTDTTEKGSSSPQMKRDTRTTPTSTSSNAPSSTNDPTFSKEQSPGTAGEPEHTESSNGNDVGERAAASADDHSLTDRSNANERPATHDPEAGAAGNANVPTQSDTGTRSIDPARSLDPALTIPSDTSRTVNTPTATTDSIANSASAQDSAITAVPPPTQPTPVVNRPQAEFHLFGGLAHTTSNRTDSDLPARSSLSPSTLATFGLEYALKFGRASVAAGVHYSTYGETASARSPDTQNVTSSTTYIIADSSMVDSTQQIFVGDTVAIIILNDTTISPGSESESLLRTSYVEVPLLVGYEHAFGRWSIGAQGGVYLGLLTSRAGSYPVRNEVGPVAVADETFRSITVGYLLRPCIKYGLNQHWSIGLMPFIKGHITDLVTEGPLTGLRYGGIGGSIGLFWRPGAGRTPALPKP